MSLLNLACKVENGTFVIWENCYRKLLFLGSSIPCGATPGTEATQFYFSPDLKLKEEVEIIAIAIYDKIFDPGNRNNNIYEWKSSFIEVSISQEEAGKLIINVNLERSAILGSKRLGHCSREGIEAIVCGKRFSSTCLEKAYAMVDANTLCSYLAGNLDADGVLRKAIDVKKEQNYKRLYLEADKLNQSLARKLSSAEEALQTAKERETLLQARLDRPLWRKALKVISNRQ